MRTANVSRAEAGAANSSSRGLPGVAQQTGKDAAERIAKLPLRAPFRKGEPAYGLLGRLAVRHGRTSVQEFAKEIGVSFRAALKGAGLNQIAALAGVDPAALSSWTVKWSGGRMLFKAEAFLVQEWNIATRARICPRCVRDDLRRRGPEPSPLLRPFRRTWWDLNAVAACPIHRCLLMSTCPSEGCRRPLDLDAALFWRCSCGEDLSELRCETLAPALVRGDAYLVGRYLGQSHVPYLALDGLPPRFAAALLYRLGWHDAHGHEKPTRAALSPRETLNLRSRGLDIAADWPAGIDALLDRLAEKTLKGAGRSNTGTPSPLGAYGHLYDWSRLQRDARIDPLRGRMAAHFLANVPVDRKTKVFGAPASTSRYVTLKHANELCELREQSRHLLQILYARGQIPAGAERWTIRVPRTEIPALQSAVRSLLSISEAAAVLATNQDTVRSLIGRGLLKVLRGPYLKGDLVKREEIERLVSRLAGGAPILPQPPVNSVALLSAWILLPASDRGRKTEGVIDALLAGRMCCSARIRGTAGFDGLMVSSVATLNSRVPDC